MCSKDILRSDCLHNSLSAADVQSVDAYLNKLYVQTAREITVSSTGGLGKPFRDRGHGNRGDGDV
jgi:hypothetical protein